ncbi:hypothetical protein [Spirosoma aerolatum]|uniref:hypothetical protein n=1 Tax=Spirosoma aerolatum TaxID=1211326 RepID=UPI0009ABE5F5|nr:hypothetical protein [Spirosoma aerolatum]
MTTLKIILQDENARPYPPGWYLEIWVSPILHTHVRLRQGGLGLIKIFETVGLPLLRGEVFVDLAEQGDVFVILYNSNNSQVYESVCRPYTLHPPNRRAFRRSPLLNLFVKRHVMPGSVSVGGTIGINQRADSRSTTLLGELTDRLSAIATIGPYNGYSVRDRLILLAN